MTNKVKVSIAAVSLLTAFAAGLFLAPKKVVTEIKTVEVEKKETQSEKEQHKKTTKIEIVRPDGTKEITTVITDDRSSKKDTNDTLTSTTDATKTVTRSSSTLTLSALGGMQLGTIPKAVYGGMVQKEVLGPISIGVFGLSNSTMGAGVSLSF